MIRHTLIFCVFATSFLTACNKITLKQHLPFDQSVRAKNLMDSGQHKQAAKLYQNLAISNPASRDQFRLFAAEALVRSGEIEKAENYADSLNLSALSPPLHNRLNLVYAHINLSYGNADEALERLNAITISQLNTEEQKSFYRARAFAHSLSGDLLASATARINLGRLLHFKDQLANNNAAILETLSLLPRETLSNKQPMVPNVLAGWMALANLLKQKSLNITDYKANISEWQQSYPNHPANAEFLDDFLISRPQHAFKQPAVIAVFLPESGPYANAAKAIKEGFLAAEQQQQYSGNLPEIRFYNSAQVDPVSLYTQAVANGAELIVGPLSKNNIEILASGTDLSIPVLALNHVENLSKENLYQFGLSPIDESLQITAKAWQDGHSKALLLTPETGQGERIANILADSWNNTGGQLLEAQFYNPKEHDFSRPIKSLLNLNESEQRFRQLTRILGSNIKFTPRRRHDVNAIFIHASPRVARSLNPQLRFYRATHVPVYATPYIFSGQNNPSQDIDLNKITFCDIPWLFPGLTQEGLSQESLRDIWQQFPKKYIRLIALGIDSYNLVAHLGTLDTVKFQGTTGNLLLNVENRITRQLICAQFKDGIPVSNGFISPSSEIFNAE